MGFTCDHEILDVVMAINDAGLKTLNSCQAEPFTYVIPRRAVSFVHVDPHALLDFGLAFRVKMEISEGWSLEMNLGNYFREPSGAIAIPSMRLSFVPALDGAILAVFRTCTTTVA